MFRWLKTNLLDVKAPVIKASIGRPVSDVIRDIEENPEAWSLICEPYMFEPSIQGGKAGLTVEHMGCGLAKIRGVKCSVSEVEVLGDALERWLVKSRKTQVDPERARITAIYDKAKK